MNLSKRGEPVTVASEERLGGNRRSFLRTVSLAGAGIVGLGALLKQLPARANDAPLVLGDCRRTFSDTGWKARLTLEAGLSATVDWWRAYLNSNQG